MRFKTIANFSALVEVHDNQVVTDSRKVAEVFEKRHADVLETIERMKTENSALMNMFCEGTYKVDGNRKSYPMYYLNRDGFSLLVMGFTGKKALEWKLKYIEAFNAMEKQLKAVNTPSYQIEDPIARAQAWIDYIRKVLSTPQGAAV